MAMEIQNLDDLFKNGLYAIKSQKIIEKLYDSLDDYGRGVIDNLVGITFNLGQLYQIKKALMDKAIGETSNEHN